VRLYKRHTDLGGWLLLLGSALRAGTGPQRFSLACLGFSFLFSPSPVFPTLRG
jgi:hypothetical protein